MTPNQMNTIFFKDLENEGQIRNKALSKQPMRNAKDNFPIFLNLDGIWMLLSPTP